MLKCDSGKLMVCASKSYSPRQRIRFVKSAAEQTARKLKLNFEMIQQGASSSPIYVYYDCGDDEPIPIYCDEGKSCSLMEISSKIRNMMFVLSFHPKHSALKQARNMLFTLS